MSVKFRGKVSKSLAVTALIDDGATVVMIEGETISVTASSKRQMSDKFDPQAGFDIALARALRNLADKLDEMHQDLLHPVEDEFDEEPESENSKSLIPLEDNWLQRVTDFLSRR